MLGFCNCSKFQHSQMHCQERVRSDAILGAVHDFMWSMGGWVCRRIRGHCSGFPGYHWYRARRVRVVSVRERSGTGMSNDVRWRERASPTAVRKRHALPERVQCCDGGHPEGAIHNTNDSLRGFHGVSVRHLPPCVWQSHRQSRHQHRRLRRWRERRHVLDRAQLLGLLVGWERLLQDHPFFQWMQYRVFMLRASFLIRCKWIWLIFKIKHSLLININHSIKNTIFSN